MAPKNASVPAPPLDPTVLLSDLSTFVPLVERREEVLQGRNLPAHIDFKAPASGRSSAEASRFARIAAEDHHLPSPRFEAFHIAFSSKHQAMLCTPTATYDATLPNHYKVSWSRDGALFRINMAFALEPLDWTTPQGMIRRAPIYLYRNLKDLGTVLYIDLKGSALRPVKKAAEKKAPEQAPKSWV